MAIVISGVNNNDSITAADGTIDLLSGVNYVGVLTAPSITASNNLTAANINVGSGIQLGNAGVATATTFVGNLTGNVNATSNLLLQIGGSEKFRVGSSGQLGIGGANYGTSGQVLTSGGSGSAATWSTVSGTTINNNADNRLITGSGSANTLEGEVNLTWNGQTFEAYNLSGPSYIAAKSNTNSGDYGIVQVQSGSTVRGRLVSDASVDAFRLDTAGRASAPFTFHTGSSYTERLRIDSDGNLLVNRTAWVDNHFDNGIYLAGSTQAGMKFMRTASGSAGTWDIGIDTDRHFKFVHAGDSGGTGVEKLRIHASGNTQIYDGDLLIGPDSVSQMEATIRAWGCSLWYTTIDSDYFHDSGGEYRQFYNKGQESGSYYLTAYNCPIQTGVGPQNRNFWRGAQNDTRAEATVNVSVGYRGAFFFISRTSCSAIRYGNSGKYLYDSNSPNRVSVSFDGFGNNIDTQELSFHCGSTAGYDSNNATVGGRLGSNASDSTLRMYAVGVNMQNYNAPNNKKAGNHLGISVINEDGTDYGSSRLSENLINNSTTGGTNGGGSSTEFNWGNRHSNDRGYNSNMQFSQLMYFDGIQLNSSQWDYLEHYFKVMYG